MFRKRARFDKLSSKFPGLRNFNHNHNPSRIDNILQKNRKPAKATTNLTRNPINNPKHTLSTRKNKTIFVKKSRSPSTSINSKLQ
jgi:hypothetical protein